MSTAFVFAFIFLLILISISTPVPAQDNNEVELQKTIGGLVHKSNGEPVENEYDGTHVELHIINGGKEYVHLDLNGLQDGWYGITIPENEWNYGDTFWIEVDGTEWGDQKDRVEDNNVKGTDEWVIYGTGAIWQDIRTTRAQKESASVTTNLTPGIALISGIAILGLGFYFTGPSRKLNVDVIVISSKVPPGSGKGSKKPIYHFGYGSPSAPVQIGKMRNVDEHLAVNSVVRVKVRGILRTADGTYTWHKPELLGLDKIKEMPILAPDTETDLDKLWYASGSIKIERGQSPKSGYNRRYARNIGLLALPFAFILFFMAFYSFFYDYPEIPPYIGEGLLFTIILLALGITGPIGTAASGRRAKVRVEKQKKGNFTVRKWAILTEGSQFADKSKEVNRVDFCASCKSLVQQNVNVCPSCQRNLVSSIEITAAEAEKYLGQQQPGQAAGTVAHTGAAAGGAAVEASTSSPAIIPKPTAAAATTPVFAQTAAGTADQPQVLPPKS
jgi:hypothetical protein